MNWRSAPALARLRLESEMSIHDGDARNAVIGDIEQMDTIIGQFLNYARGESGENPELSDINTLIAQVVSSQGRATTSPQIFSGSLPKTLIQPKALARALVNLFENARKYGGNELAVETRAENGEIMIDVLDRGPGIPESEIERLKRPFTRLENARTNTTGTGLGLAIVERIARLHGGRLELLAREGGGLLARLRLPIRN